MKILDVEKYRNKEGYVENINLTPEELHQLLDYIIKLQQENQQLKKSIKLLTDDLANMTNRALQLEKQKDDVVEYITSEESINTFTSIESREQWIKINKKLLKMLGEIDD